MILNAPSDSVFKDWLLNIKRLNIRGLIVCSTDDPFIEQVRRGHTLLTNSGVTKNEVANTLIRLPSPEPKQSNSTKADAILGGEFETVIFDASKNFDVNLFAAISGTLVGGGILLLLVEKSVTKQILTQFNQLENTLPADTGSDDMTYCKSATLQRLLQELLKAKSCTVSYDGQFYYSSCLDEWQAIQQDSFTEQQQVIDKIKRVATGHARRPLVITANRGRGKSAALGLAASQLVQKKCSKIIVTAPQLGNLASFYKHLKQSITGFSELSPAQINKQITSNGSQIKFMAVDDIIHNQPEASLLLIDEAAAIPVKQLQLLSENYNRLVFATTSHGYEGNGKGFEVRFKKRLLEVMPATRFATLSTPVRWSTLDELETSSFKSLLLDCQLDALTSQSTPEAQLKFECLNKTALRQSENDLANIFALLVNAHYQTRPADLEMMLSDPANQVMLLREEQQIVAVALVNQEGELDEESCDQLVENQHRLKGELLPQSIMAHYGLKQAGSMTFYRIMRIAVHPQRQNCGLGSLLLSRIFDVAKKHNVDFIGASFAASADVVSFWLKNAYQATRFGHSRDSSSGAHSLEVLKPLNARPLSLLKQIKERFNDALLFKLGGELNELETDLVRIILLNDFNIESNALDEHNLFELRRFSEGKRGFSMVDALLQKAFLVALGCHKSQSKFSNEEFDFLIECLLKQKDFKALAKHFAFCGQKQSIKYLRQLTLKLLPS